MTVVVFYLILWICLDFKLTGLCYLIPRIFDRPLSSDCMSKEEVLCLIITNIEKGRGNMEGKDYTERGEKRLPCYCFLLEHFK